MAKFSINEDAPGTIKKVVEADFFRQSGDYFDFISGPSTTGKLVYCIAKSHVVTIERADG